MFVFATTFLVSITLFFGALFFVFFCDHVYLSLCCRVEILSVIVTSLSLQIW